MEEASRNVGSPAEGIQRKKKGTYREGLALTCGLVWAGEA
jgi:hypothetical protein